MGIENLTKESITQHAEAMTKAERDLADAIKYIEDTCDWLKDDFAGQNELVWVQNVQATKVTLYDFHELVKKQAEKLCAISELFDANI